MGRKRDQFVVVVLQKNLRAAKTRLRSVLPPEAKLALTLQWLRRVLHTCAQLPDKSWLFLCGPEDLKDLAEEYGATVIPGGFRGMRRDLTLAAEDWRIFGKAAMLAVSSDLPLLKLEDLQAFVDAWRACADVVLGPDRRKRGTNVIMVNEPEHFSYAFGEVVGPGSFTTHMSQAEGTGLEVAVVDRIGVALDIDLPEDLALYIRLAPDDPLAQYARARCDEAFRFE